MGWCGLVQMAGDVVKKAREQGLIVITAGKGDVVRLVPPLIITEGDVDIAVSILSEIINNL
jgi:acetylornithine aminotransferase